MTKVTAEMLNDQGRINKISYIMTGKYGSPYDILKTKTLNKQVVVCDGKCASQPQH